MRRRDFLAASLAAAASPASAEGEASGQIRLANHVWRVEVDPATLAISATPRDAASCPVSRGVSRHVVSQLQTGAASASWRWDERFRIACTLDGSDLSIRVTANEAGELALLDQPTGAIGKGLLLPLGEGHYLPAGDTRWAGFLAGKRWSTTEDLSLPLWGLDHGAFSLHWLLTNPFNNELRFDAEANGLALGLAHSFTSLGPDTPMTMTLHLGGADLLAGAKRYRRYLVETGSWRSLKEKIARTPSGARLIGATHVYLWGNTLIGAKDVRDWPGFLDRLRGPGMGARLRGRFDADSASLVASAPASPPPYQRRAIVRAVDDALNDLARAEWQLEEVDPVRLVAAYAGLREAFSAGFGPVLAPDASEWGDGLSRATFAALAAAGIDRLWIGLGDGWEGGLWRPDAVRDAGARGWLIAPYDSYETAIPPGERPDWATAQLGRGAYEKCAVIRRNGTPTPGFSRTGHYTSTRCVRPLLEARIRALAAAGGYNSWFLDVFATGMVFNDYRPGQATTMAENAAANTAAPRWVSETLQLPTGSEGGNALGAEGVLFAHGIETPVLGWGDPDLRKDAASPFFLGRWYPSDSPEIFFKPVPMKEPYRTLHFDPAMRLPLHQAVFHGSLIVSHHWEFDQLKLANVSVERSLIQQLYNVPPLFHLSAATLDERLPVVAEHDRFFRPLHERLALKTMEGFRWLSEDRLVQQTGFEDGTRLIANFADRERIVEGMHLPPRSVTALVDGRRERVFTARS